MLTAQRLLDDTLAIPTRVRALFDGLVDVVECAIGPHDVDGIEAVHLGGSGDLHHSALASDLAFERLTGLRAVAMPSMRMGLYAAGGFSRRSLLIQMTFSGKTARAVECATLARQAGARVWGLTHDPLSPMGRLSDVHLTKPDTGGNEAAGFPVTILMLYLVALRIAELRGRLSAAHGASLRAVLANTPDSMQRTLDHCVSPARALAERHLAATHVLFLGTGPAFASAVNGSARIHEAVGINAAAQDIEEWVHLNRWVEERESPTFVIVPAGPGRERAKEVLAAMQKLGKPGIAVTPANDTGLGAAAAAWLPVHCDLPEEFSPLVYSLPGELFAHQSGVVRGASPYREGNPAYGELGEIRWGGWIRRALPESELPAPRDSH